MNTKIIVALVLGIALVGLTGAASATTTDKYISSHFALKGTGVIDVALNADTADYYSGLALRQYAYTPSLGMYGPSHIEYSSTYNVGIFNITKANRFSSIHFEQSGNMKNAKCYVTLKNYMVGAVMGYKAQGNTTHLLEAYGDAIVAEIDVSGEIEGKMKLFSKVVDPKTRNVQFSEVNEFAGQYVYEWGSYADLIHHPDEEIDPDWLGCP